VSVILKMIIARIAATRPRRPRDWHAPKHQAGEHLHRPDLAAATVMEGSWKGHGWVPA
jgi:hypothetical protein